MTEYLSPEGLEKLKQELQQLKTQKLQDIAARLAHAVSLGDLSENAEYQETKAEQELVETQIAEIEDRIRNTVLIQKDHRKDQVTIGSTVRVRSKHGEEIYRIVGSEEANPVEGRISNESPIGKAFLGRKVGDGVEIKTPSGMTTYQLISIS